MRTPWITLLLTTLLACGGDEKTSATSNAGSTTDASTDASGTTGGTTTSGASSGEPTTGDSDSGSAGTDPPTTTGGVDVGVEGVQSMCTGNPLLPDGLNTPPAAAPGLSAMALGGGKVSVSESEFEENCGFTLTPLIEADAGTVTITYETAGEPADCLCLFTIDYTLTGLTPGTWTIVSGALSAMVDVT